MIKKEVDLLYDFNELNNKDEFEYKIPYKRFYIYKKKNKLFLKYVFNYTTFIEYSNGKWEFKENDDKLILIF